MKHYISLTTGTVVCLMLLTTCGISSQSETDEGFVVAIQGNIKG